MRCQNFDVEGLHDCNLVHANYVDDLIVHWKESICETLGNGKSTNKEFLEDLWLIPTLNNLRNYLDPKDEAHHTSFETINDIKKEWDSKWSKVKDLENIIDVSDVRASRYNFVYE